METQELVDIQSAINNFGCGFEEKIVSALGLQPGEDFSDVASLTNVMGHDCGSVRVYRNDTRGLIEKAAFLSIGMMPGMRYFNIHIIPKPQFNIPRFSFEGMLNAKGSQLSVDLYPDLDVSMNLDYFHQHYQRAHVAYQRARFEDDCLHIETSRLMHMRAACSPYLLLAYGIAPDNLEKFSGYAEAYLEDWLALCRMAMDLSEEEATQKIARRAGIMQAIIDADPDRDKVVMLFGEAITQRIEQATMLADLQ
ncbi:hypothetical protein [Biformimicrobium ophioploci]|uniref:Uncharacterized protein n=1 Tax=Biformimicrobium ophioploci TaxID=3036711 RepID=A0ABQ6LW21_9GAMM|nr:hypothetical protein [Microbulbifer sp. NKW57]GMG86280.1 hypothetical protein MNKW57_06010 [Microbulbifer sp. NKW57]